MRETLTSRPRIAQLRSQLARRAMRLRFEPDLEREYRAHLQKARLARRWISTLTGILLPLTIVVADHLVLGKRLSDAVHLLILGGICAPLIAVALLRALGRLRHITISTLLYVHVGLAFIAVAVLSTDDSGRPPFMYVALLIHSTATYFVSGLRLGPSCLVGFGLCGAYVVAERAIGLAAPALWESGLFLFAANVAGAGGRYVLESLERRQYLSAQLLEELASHDSLTGTLNRVAFENGLDTAWRQAVREGASLLLGVLDVDRFKAFNDQLGHARGDELLLAVAEGLRASAQRPLDLVSRIGGDEFVCVWYGVPAGHAREFVRGVHRGLNDALAAGIPQGAPRVSVSLGAIHISASDGTAPRSLFARADAALYRAKAAGRCRAALVFREADEPEVL